MRRLTFLALSVLAACSGSPATSSTSSTGRSGATAAGANGSANGATSSGGTTGGSSTTASTTTTAGTTAGATTTGTTSTTGSASTTGTAATTGTTGSSVVANITKVVSLHAVTRTGIVVFFDTDVSVLATVDLAPVGGGSAVSAADSSATTHHVISVSGLSPNTNYGYTVHAGTAQAAGDFFTAPDAATSPAPFTFAVVGDTRGLSDWTNIANAVLAKSPRFIVQTGDNDADWSNSDQAWRDYYAAGQNLFAHVPVFAAQGNHDAVPDYSQFNVAPISSSQSDTYYAFVYGNAGFVAIDGNSSSTTQTSWVQNALSTLSGGPLFAFQHQPLYSCGVHGSSSGMQQRYQAPFESSHVTTDFAGHDHDLIYWAPLNGVQYVVSGGGGSTLYPLGLSETCQGPYSTSDYGFMLVTVDGATVTQKFYDQTGTQTFTDTLTAAGPSVPFANLGNLVVY